MCQVHTRKGHGIGGSVAVVVTAGVNLQTVQFSQTKP
jgi:hypothetical protein